MITIVGWKKLQHYSQRKERWVKISSDILEDPRFRSLSDHARALLLDLWLLAAKKRQDGVIVMNVQDVAWELRDHEMETCMALTELSEMTDENGDPRWVEWDVTGLDSILQSKCKQVASSAGSEPLLNKDSEKTKSEKLNSPSTPPPRTDASELQASRKQDPPEEPKPLPEPHVTDASFEPAIEPEGDEEYTGWLAPYAKPYEERMGKKSFNYGRGAAAFKPLEMAHGKAKVQLHWAIACETEDERYLNPQTFKEKFATYDPEKQELSDMTPEEHLQAG